MKYQLTTIKDIFDKIPADRIRVCMEELTALIVQAKAVDDLFREVAHEVTGNNMEKACLFPENIEWVDDDKGTLTLNVKVNGENVATIETEVKP